MSAVIIVAPEVTWSNKATHFHSPSQKDRVPNMVPSIAPIENIATKVAPGAETG